MAFLRHAMFVLATAGVGVPAQAKVPLADGEEERLRAEMAAEASSEIVEDVVVRRAVKRPKADAGAKVLVLGLGLGVGVVLLGAAAVAFVRSRRRRDLVLPWTRTGEREVSGAFREAARENRSEGENLALRNQAIAQVKASSGPVRLFAASDEPGLALRLERLGSYVERHQPLVMAEFRTLATACDSRLVPEVGYLAHLLETRAGLPLSASLPPRVWQWLCLESRHFTDATRRIDPTAFLTLLLQRLDAATSGLGILTRETAAMLSSVPDFVVVELIRGTLGVRLGACLLALLPASRSALVLRQLSGSLALKLMEALRSDGKSYTKEDVEAVLESLAPKATTLDGKDLAERFETFFQDLWNAWASSQAALAGEVRLHAPTAGVVTGISPGASPGVSALADRFFPKG